MRKRIIALVLTTCLSLAALFGCAPKAQTEEQQAQQKNRDYMTQVNQSMDDLDTELDGFIDAVSRGDVVSMRTQADDAFAELDALADIKAPEGLEDVQASYTEGSQALEEALNGYIDLYTEIDSATADDPFDWGSYDSRIAQIKTKYDEGIEKLQSADNLAASMK